MIAGISSTKKPIPKGMGFFLDLKRVLNSRTEKLKSHFHNLQGQ